LKITNKVVYHNLDKLHERSPQVSLSNQGKWVIFSDLHMGDGGSTDDFKRNASLFIAALKDYYQARDYSLLLNGDVEELQRFSLNKIMGHWKPVYQLFEAYAKQDRLIKTFGNHDLQLRVLKPEQIVFPVLESVRFTHNANELFVFHGHQASKKYQKHNELVGFTLKYFANPLGIKNYSVSHSSRKQYKIEKRVYHYSAYNKRVSIIGHTHRPLFESLHKVERLKYKIEQLCRDYAQGSSAGDDHIKQSIKAYKKELKKYYKENEDTNFQNYVYNTIFHIPCVFNSGTVIGKRGMTCLEIDQDQIKLVHWFDKNISKKYLQQTGYTPEQLGESDYYRMVINQEALKYIFTRIKFLS
jgi:predicted phosphodiesterase